MATLTEDDIYRSSTQYRLWSFTRESMSSLRSTTNESAAGGVRAAIESLHSQEATDQLNKQDRNGDATKQTNQLQKEVDCLSVEEEQKLVGFYCLKTMEFADFCEFPTNVKATAVQFLKRFYLSNSPMTYHPKEMMPSALFLATKTENHYTSLKNFVSKLDKISSENVIAPEFLLTQGLRFTFDVRHPYRGLEGGCMELLSLATRKMISGPNNEIAAAQVQKEMMGLEPANDGSKTPMTAEEVVGRIHTAHGEAKKILKTAALLTDAYFLYTPSQIWLSSLLLADEPLARFYLDFKLPTPFSLKPKILVLIGTCADLLRTSASARPGETEMRELMRIDKKLYKCRNPEKMDLVGINKTQKREGNEDGLDQKTIKKRKLEREKSEKEVENIFGPKLAKDGK